MKNKKTKTALILAIVFIIAGVCMGVGGMSALGWDWNKLDTREFEERFYQQADADIITSIDVDVNDFPIKIVKGDKVSLKYYVQKGSEVTVSLKDNALKISDNSKWQVNFKFFNFSQRYYQLTVPDNLDIKINSTNCEIQTDSLTTKNLYIDSTNLDIIAGSILADDFTIKSTNAGIKSDVVKAQKFDIDSTNLDVEIGDLHATSFVTHGTNVDIMATNCVVTKLDFDVTNLDFVSRLTADDISFKFVNFDCFTDIKIVGNQADYYVGVDVVNGKPFISQPGNGSGKKLVIKGVNFDGKIIFAQ